MKDVWTDHARERVKVWQTKRGVTEPDVSAIVTNPDQIVSGDRDAQGAQSRYGDGLLRVPFVEVAGGRQVLTVYWPSQVERYWEGESDDQGAL